MKLSAAYGVLLWIGVFYLGRSPLASAEPPRTALVLSPHSDDAALVEVTARVRGELSAAGFRVITREPPAGVSAERAVAMAGADLAPSAVLWIVAASEHTAAAPALEIWLSDRLLGKVSMARLRGAKERGETPKVLAVQAVELLRARMSELRVDDAEQSAQDAAAWVERPPPAPVAVAPEPVRDVAPAPEASRGPPWFGVSLGLAYLFGSGTLAAAPMLALALALGLGEPRPVGVGLAWDLALNAGAFGARQRLREARGSARVDQAYGELRAGLRLVTRVPVEPFVALGAGVYSLGVRGSAEPPFVAHRERHWTPTGSVSVGVRSRPYAHLSLLLSGELLSALSRADVNVASARVARAGGAMWLLRAELMGVF
jgi:hypothetical protein